MLGDRIHHVRSYYGWSQTQLAAMAGVTPSAISQIERGGPAKESTVKSIAAASGFSVGFFYQGRLPDLPEGSLRFRKRASSRKLDDERVRSHVRQASMVVAHAETQVNLPPVRIRSMALTATCTGEDIEEAASEAREALGIGPNDPIPHLIRAVERAGIVVVGSVAEIEKHDAASYWQSYPDGRPIICYAKRLPGDRQRYNIAHELGHLMLHQLRSPEDAEAEANRFAGALLFPREAAFELVTEPVTLRNLAQIKAKYGISIGALVRRCLDLHLVDERRRTSLEKQISSRGWRKDEPVDVQEEQPLLIRKIIETSTGRKQLTRMAEAVDCPPLILAELIA